MTGSNPSLGSSFLKISVHGGGDGREEGVLGIKSQACESRGGGPTELA